LLTISQALKALIQENALLIREQVTLIEELGPALARGARSPEVKALLESRVTSVVEGMDGALQRLAALREDMPTSPPLQNITQRLIDAVTLMLARFRELHDRLRAIEVVDTAVTGEFAMLVQEIITAAGDSLTRFLAAELELLVVVAGGLFPVQ
jgi:hypothetical protein